MNDIRRISAAKTNAMASRRPGQPLAPPLRGRVARLSPLVLISAGLHVALAMAALGADHFLHRKLADGAPVYATVEMVQQDSPNVGKRLSASAEADEPVQNATPPPPPAAPPPAPPAPAASPASVPMPAPASVEAPAPPEPESETPTQQALQTPQTRLGDASAFGTGLVENVIPAGPDSTVHNDPPSYPLLAARYGEEGTVTLKVLVAADGSARQVLVAQTSGYDRLDRAAREAVAKWHFRPAQQGGIAVESYYTVNVQFDARTR
jgi:protein TonB